MANEERTVGWAAQVTEFERGWGSRPDGIVLARTPEDVKTLERPDGHLCGDIEEYSTVTGQFRRFDLTEAGKEVLEKVPARWISNSVWDYIVKGSDR